MTRDDKIIQDMRRDLLFVMSHPMQACKVCANRDRECHGAKCEPIWRGDETVRLKKPGGDK